VRLFDHVTELLEIMLDRPSSTLAFALTFLTLATAIPAIFRFAPAMRLANALEKLGAYHLLFSIFFSPSLRVDESSATLTAVPKAVLAQKSFGQAEEI
jgi:hypothetical protein